jgi:PHP family Zn ribbon phosphoesterase
MTCSACSGRLVDSDLHHAVQECAECGAVLSSGISRGDVSRFVNLNKWDALNASRPFSDSLRFFDFTILNGNGTVNRVHGWFNHFTKNIVQVG